MPSIYQVVPGSEEYCDRTQEDDAPKHKRYIEIKIKIKIKIEITAYQYALYLSYKL